MSDTPKVIIPGNLKGSVPENIVTDALYILDSSRAKNQKVINDEFEQRIDDIQELAEISIEGGTIQIANAADFNNPTQEQRAKVPTVGAVIDGYTANILPNTGNPSTPIYIDNFHRPQVVTSILLPGNISSQNGNIEALNGGVAAFGIGTLSLGGGGGGGDVSSILFNPAVPYVEGEGYIAVEGILSLPAYPGSASVQSWGFAKGIKIGATSTPYFSEAGIITIPAYPNISGKADKVVNATEGNFASLDALGNLQDAGVNALSFATAAQGAKADAAEIALAQIMTPKGNHSLPVYINTSGIPTVIDSLSVTGNIQSTQGGVSAFGIGSLALGGGGGQGTLTEIQIDGTTIPDVEGIVDLPAYPTWATLSGRPTLSAVATSGRFIDLTDTPTTLAGYGILDAKINNGVITLGLDTITPITSHQTIYTLTIQRNGVTVDSFNAASANKTINIEDVASLSAFNTLVGHLTSKGSHSRPIYLNGTPEGVEIDSLNVPGNIESTQGGVSAFGISNLAVSGGSGTGTLTQIQINGTPVTDTDGIVNITATTGSSAGKIAVAGQQIAVNGLGSAAYASTSDFASANHTQPFLTLTNLPTTLSGYGITDAASSSDLSSLSGRVNEIEGYFDGGIANSAARLSNNAKTGDTNNPVYFTANGVPAAISYTIGRNVAANEDVTAYQGGDSINITNHVVKVQMAGTSSPSASGNDISFIDTISQSTAGVLTATKKTVRSATQSQSGVVTTGEQIFAGAKTFNSTLTAIDDITSTTGDIMALAGGVSAFGIASLSSSGGSGSGTLTQIQVNGIALGDTEGIVNITATSGSSNGQIKIAGQDINVTGLGQAAYCGVGQVYSGNSGLVTGGQVYSAISALPTPMQFKGSLGVGGTYTASTLPPAAASNNGWDLKVITDGTYQGVVAKVGDQLISDGTNWILIPSGDEPSGTVTSVGMTVPTGLSVSGSPITSSGTLAISFASGYSIPTTSKQSNWDTAYTNSHTHSNITLSTTAQAYDGSHTIALPSSDPYTSARIPSSHTHGNIQNGGTLQTNDITVANGDKLVVTDASDSAKVARTSISFDASTTNKALTPKGTWESFLQTHQSIYTLTIQKNGTTIDTFDPKASPNKTINISDVASASTLSSHVGNTNNPHSVQLVVGTGNDAYKIKTTNGTFITVPYATIAGKVGTSTVGSTSLPVYINSGVPAIITSLSVPGNIQSTAGGVSANGIVSLALNGGGGGGTLTQIQINGVPLSEESGIVNIAADQTYNASTNKIATQATVTNAINALDYTAIGLGTGKTLASLTEVNGVIGATFQDISIAISQVSGLQSALDNKLSTSLKGAANGLAELDSNGFVPSSQLPSYVDDVLEYPSLSDFPSTGTAGKIYVALDTNLTYRWSGTTYVEISPSLALGETSSTAYRGDRGATAYAHATDASRLTTAKSSGFYKFATTSEGHIASVTAVSASDLTTLIGNTTYAPYNSAGYLPLSGGTMTNTNLVTNLNTDLLDGYHASQFFIRDTHRYGLENLCTGVVQGGRTSVVDGKIVTDGTAGDTYFFIKTSETITAGQIYTFGFYVEGWPDGETRTWFFRMSNNYYCATVAINGNGWYWGTGIGIPDGGSSTSRVLIDDLAGLGLALTFSKFILVKGDAFPYYTPPISQMHVASAAQLTTARTIWGQSFNGTSDIGTDKYAKMPYLLFRTVTSGSDATIGYVGRDSISNTINLKSYSGVPVSLGSNQQDDLYITTDHKIGVGLSNPSDKFHVNGNIIANGGVAAGGIASMSMNGGSAAGAVTQINVGSTPYTPTDGIVSLPAYPTWATLSGKPSNVSAFTNDSGYIDSSALAVTFTTTTLTSSSTSVYLNNTVQRDTFQKITISSASYGGQTFSIRLTGSGSYYGYHRQVLVMNNSGKNINLSLTNANYIYIGTYEWLTSGGWQHNDSNPIPMDSNNQMFLLDIIQASSSEYPVVKVTRMNFWAD